MNFQHVIAGWEMNKSETYLGPSQTSMIELFSEKSERLKAIHIIDAWLGHKYVYVNNNAYTPKRG